MDDLELLAAWQRGDRRAGDELIQRHFESVCRFFRSKLGDDVEDLIQRTFLDLLEVAGKGAVESVLGTLFTIARRRLVDHLRVAYRREMVTEISVADLGTSPSGVVARSEEERILGEALRRISLDHQIALELAYWEDLSGPEIAQVLGIGEHTVRSRLARAREALRGEVEKLARTPALVRTTIENLGIDRPGRATPRACDS